MNLTTLVTALAALMTTGAQTRSADAEKEPGQLIRQGAFELNISADKALVFFTPEGERAWAKGWDPKAVYPLQATVAFQQDAVFRVDDDEERSLWTIVEADSQRHVAEYVYVVEGNRLSRVRVQIEPLGEKRCRVHVRYIHTATSAKGQEFLATVTEEAFAQKMQHWQQMLSDLIR